MMLEDAVLKALNTKVWKVSSLIARDVRAIRYGESRPFSETSPHQVPSVLRTFVTEGLAEQRKVSPAKNITGLRKDRLGFEYRLTRAGERRRLSLGVLSARPKSLPNLM